MEPRPTPGEPLDEVFIDTVGKLTAALNGHQYAVILTDTKTRMRWVITTQSKDVIVQELLKWVQLQYKQFGKRVRILFRDGGSEFSRIKEYCDQHGIRTDMSAPYTPEQNGVAEAANKRPDVPPVNNRPATPIPPVVDQSDIPKAPEVPTIPDDVWQDSTPTEQDVNGLSEALQLTRSDNPIPGSPSSVGSDYDSCNDVPQKLDQKTTEFESKPERPRSKELVRIGEDESLEEMDMTMTGWDPVRQMAG
ncbi:hypothetical protein K3495_g7860 [Podosphaera aphanis]|nr:hypothetical protein K3495_g7860 [Podosphaera aphanis]